MSAGLPGAGIAGLFYLLGALLMPLCEAARALRQSPARSRWTLVLRQSTLAATIVFGVWLTGWLLGFLLIHNPAEVARGAPVDLASPQLISQNSILLTFATFIIVLGTIEVLWLLRCSQRTRGA